MGPFFLYWEQTKHIVLNGTSIFLYRAQIISEKDIQYINEVNHDYCLSPFLKSIH